MLKNKWIILCFLGINCLGQTNSDTTQKTNFLAPLVIESNYLKLPNSFRTETITVTPDKFSNNLGQLLNHQTGIYIKSYGKGQLSTVSLRGTGASQTQVYWNGFAINSPTLGQLDFSLLPVFFIQSATVNYGNSSLMNGNGGIGGSINLHNITRIKEGWSGEIQQELASFSNYTTTLKTSYANNKQGHQLKFYRSVGKNNFPYVDISKQEQAIVNQKNNEIKQYAIQYEGNYIITNKNKILTTVYYVNSNRNLPALIGMSQSFKSQWDEHFRTFIEWQNYYSDRLFFSIKSGFFSENLHYKDPLAHLNAITSTRSFQSQGKMSYKLLQNIKITGILIANHSNAQSQGLGKKQTRKELSTLLKWEHQIKKVGYDIMLRQGIIDGKIIPFVYGLGINYKIKNSLLAKASAAKNVRYPTLNDLYWNPGGTPNLKPEIGWNTEVGLKWNYKKTEWELTGFYGVITNWIQWTPTANIYWSPQNIKKVENKGIETRFLYHFMKEKRKTNGTIQFTYSYTQSINKQSATKNDLSIGKQLIYVPKHKVAFTGKLTLPFIHILYEQIFASKVYIDASNSIYLPYYIPANISFLKEFTIKKIKLNTSFTINNIYNESYHVVANNPIPGRNFSLTMGVKF